MDNIERLERLEKALADLMEKNALAPIIVEGLKDIRALRKLGISGEIISLNQGKPVFNFCEEISRDHGSSIILTDWDRRGGNLCWRMREAFKANGTQYDDKLRKEIAYVSYKEIKTVEALPKYLANLKKNVGERLYGKSRG